MPLDPPAANIAASIRTDARVSVADAHVGAAIQGGSADLITVSTSNPADMRRVAGDIDITVVTV